MELQDSSSGDCSCRRLWHTHRAQETPPFAKFDLTIPNSAKNVRLITNFVKQNNPYIVTLFGVNCIGKGDPCTFWAALNTTVSYPANLAAKEI